MIHKMKFYVLAMSALSILAGNSLFAKHDYRVTITNLTKGQIFSPALVATHSPEMTPIFELGEEASIELAAAAEDADLSGLLALMGSDPDVYEAAITGGPVLPGDSISVQLKGVGKRSSVRISLVGMLVTTNDAFFALNAVRVPVPFSFAGRTESYMSLAYDAGSEVNNEDCEFIPGPPCGNGGVRAEVDAEGYVYIHPGIHGIGDLSPDQFDWRNPVAKITVEAVWSW